MTGLRAGRWLWALLAALPGASAMADVWDDAGDGSVGTANVLWHTAPAQRHDLANAGGVSDQDWFRVNTLAFRSYEVQLVNPSFDLATITVRRTNNVGGLIENSSALDATGKSRTFRWKTTADGDERIQVQGTPSQTASAQYDILLRESTLYCPRWNNAGTQVSVVILQRANSEASGSCDATVYFYNENAVQLASSNQALALNKVSVVATGSIPALVGEKGAAHIAHTCGIGGVKAKLVALEPSTGFSFDTPCSERER